MDIKLHILEESGCLTPYISPINSGFEKGLEKVKQKLKVSAVDVVVADNPSSAIPETGMGGYAPTGHLIYVSIDPLFPHLEHTLEAEMRSTLAHELHHCARAQAVGYGKNLLEALVSEGLADHFDIEINHGAPKPWSVAIQGEQFQQLMEKAEKEFTNEKYNHDQWFFGSDKESIPRWAGYSLAFHIVGAYMKETGEKASELVDVPATLFIS